MLCCALCALACRGPKEPSAPAPAPAVEPKLASGPSADPALLRLLASAASGDFAMAKALLDQGVDVNGVDPNDARRNTPLLAAVEPGHFTVVKLLLGRGADASRANALGETAFDIARKKNHEAILVLLGMRKASEVQTPEPLAKPIDPAKLDPGALIAKIEAIAQQPASGGAPSTAARPSAVAAPEEQPAPPVAPTQPAVPELPPNAASQVVPEEQARAVCAQLQTAIAQLEASADVDLEALGMTREAALEQLRTAQGSNCD